MTRTPRQHRQQPGGLFADDLDVLTAAGLTTAGADPVPFGADRWDLRAARGTPSWARAAGDTTADWGVLPPGRWATTCKETALLLLAPAEALRLRVPYPRRRPLPAHQVAVYVRMWARWLDWLTTVGVHDLADVDQDVCDAWLTQRRGQVGAKQLSSEINRIRDLGRFRQVVTGGTYPAGFVPFGDTPASKVAGRKPEGENTTPVVPYAVHAPLLAAALFLVETAAPDILAASDEWALLQAVRGRFQGRRAGQIDALLQAHLDDRREQGWPLPLLTDDQIAVVEGTRGRPVGTALERVHLPLLARQAGLAPSSLVLRRMPRRRRAILEHALADLGTAPGGLATPVSHISDPAGPGGTRPWRGPFAPMELHDLRRLLYTAALIVVAALSGMRRSEIMELRRGCVRTVDLGDGRVRHRLAGKVIKGQRPGGRDEEWTVIGPVVAAVELAEQLADGDLLFAFGDFGSRYANLRAWVNGPAGQHAGLTPIPEFPVTLRALRRTLARKIAWQPHGIVAGKLHLKQVSVATTEGYAGRPGSSAAAFLDAVEHERACARDATVLRLFDEFVAGRPVTGPGAAELTGVFAEVADELDSDVDVVDPGRVLALLRRRTDTLHVTPLAHCWFTDPGRARCLNGRGGDRPLVGACEPTRCVNATIHPEHLPVWSSALDEVETLLGDRRVPPLERDRLQAERVRLAGVVAGLDDEDVEVDGG